MPCKYVREGTFIKYETTPGLFWADRSTSREVQGYLCIAQSDAQQPEGAPVEYSAGCLYEWKRCEYFQDYERKPKLEKAKKLLESGLTLAQTAKSCSLTEEGLFDRLFVIWRCPRQNCRLECIDPSLAPEWWGDCDRDYRKKYEVSDTREFALKYRADPELVKRKFEGTNLDQDYLIERLEEYCQVQKKKEMELQEVEARRLAYERRKVDFREALNRCVHCLRSGEDILTGEEGQLKQLVRRSVGCRPTWEVHKFVSYMDPVKRQAIMHLTIGQTLFVENPRTGYEQHSFEFCSLPDEANHDAIVNFILLRRLPKALSYLSSLYVDDKRLWSDLSTLIYTPFWHRDALYRKTVSGRPWTVISDKLRRHILENISVLDDISIYSVKRIQELWNADTVITKYLS